jgi:hypothetical protein
MGLFKWLFRGHSRQYVPIPDHRDRIAAPPPEYMDGLRDFSNVLSDCINVSREHGGISSPSTKHYYASSLFTGLVTRALSLAFLAPYSDWSKRDFEHWDFASVANVTRSIMEMRLTFYYLCIEKCTEDEWRCRWNLFNLHDCVARIALMRTLSQSDDVEGLTSQADELRHRLLENTYFTTNFDERRQKDLLKGGKSHLRSLEELAVSTGMELRVFKMMWKLMSAHVHSLPLSFYRMGDNDHGSGVQTKMEEQYTTMLLTLVMVLLTGARDEFTELMKPYRRNTK